MSPAASASRHGQVRGPARCRRSTELRGPRSMAKEVERCKDLLLRLTLLRPEAAVRLRSTSHAGDLLHLARVRRGVHLRRRVRSRALAAGAAR